jgi:hypothetical protein
MGTFNRIPSEKGAYRKGVARQIHIHRLTDGVHTARGIFASRLSMAFPFRQHEVSSGQSTGLSGLKGPIEIKANPVDRYFPHDRQMLRDLRGASRLKSLPRRSITKTLVFRWLAPGIPA